jgi:uncharacterized protein YbcI
MSDTQDHQAPQAACSTISNTVVQIMNDYTGRGQSTARTTIRDNIVTVTVPDAMLKAERSLVANGKTDVVLQTRRYFQQTMRDELSAAVERLTQREVIAFTAHNHLAPDYSVEIFLLAPEGSGGAPEQEGGHVPDQFVRHRANAAKQSAFGRSTLERDRLLLSQRRRSVVILSLRRSPRC